LFIAVAAIAVQYNVRTVDRLWELRNRSPWLSAVFVVGGWSLVGLPPMCGFFGKWYVLKGALSDDRWGLAAALVLGSLATAAYVARILEQLFFARVPDADAPPPRAGVRLTVAAGVVLAAGIVLLGLFSGRVIPAVIQPALPMGL
jgi:multicomponent Na+:H+ antiporter subunit D